MTDETVAVYTANCLVWGVAETVVESMSDGEQVLKFVKMMSESSSTYMNNVLVGWRHTYACISQSE